MTQNYDAFREIERVENRFQTQMDRRFNDVEKMLERLERNIEALQKKIDENSQKLENRQYEKSTWTIRQIITVVISFTMGGGALSVVQLIVNALSKGR